MVTVALIVGIIISLFLLDRVFNTRHTIQRNFPIIGWARRILEKFGPELRQYIVASNRDELPFNRTQRSWIYATSKLENNLSGFGTDADLNKDGHVFIMHSHFPLLTYPHLGKRTIEYGGRKVKLPAKDAYRSPKIIGPTRRSSYRPNIVNISAMSYGALSPTAVKALNTGACIAGSFHNTGEGGYHPELHSTTIDGRETDVVFQIGTGYFGCRYDTGEFSMDKLVRLVRKNKNIRMIEIKLSQGAKPGKGGVLPGSKVNAHIAASRGLKAGEDAISPAAHTAFSNVKELIEFIEKIAAYTDLPVGIKSAVSGTEFWNELFMEMKMAGYGPDFITIDGGEGGTGAAPVSFAAHVSLPLNDALATIKQLLIQYELDVFLIASGKLGFPEQVIKAMSFGADSVNVAREALMSIGCIQSQQCHTNRCPSGVATQNKWLYHGLDPMDKGARCANYLLGLQEEVFAIAAACGHAHPSKIKDDQVSIRTGGKITKVFDLIWK